MKKLFESFRRFLTESEEDATLGKLLQLDPEHAASFIDSLKDVYPNIERRYVEALGVKRERLRKEGRKQDIIIARLSDENKKINSEWDRISNEEGGAAGRKFFEDNLDRLNSNQRKMREASYEKARFFDDARELSKIMAKFNPEIVVPFAGIKD